MILQRKAHKTTGSIKLGMIQLEAEDFTKTRMLRSIPESHSIGGNTFYFYWSTWLEALEALVCSHCPDQSVSRYDQDGIW